MAGETNLDTLLKNMQPTLHEKTYVFCTGDREWAALEPVMLFQEAEGTTAIVDRDAADTHGLEYNYPCRMITLNIHSGLEAVGFLAAITNRLAEAGISVNPVSAYYHDHLFVPEDKTDTAMEILAGF